MNLKFKKIQSHSLKCICYVCVHFNDMSENKTNKTVIKLKNQNGTHHAVFAYKKFQVQLSRVTESLMSNIVKWILIRT
jgi:hypothetical protein